MPRHDTSPHLPPLSLLLGEGEGRCPSPTPPPPPPPTTSGPPTLAHAGGYGAATTTVSSSSSSSSASRLESPASSSSGATATSTVLLSSWVKCAEGAALAKALRSCMSQGLMVAGTIRIHTDDTADTAWVSARWDPSGYTPLHGETACTTLAGLRGWIRCVAGTLSVLHAAGFSFGILPDTPLLCRSPRLGNIVTALPNDVSRHPSSDMAPLGAILQALTAPHPALRDACHGVAAALLSSAPPSAAHLLDGVAWLRLPQLSPAAAPAAPDTPDTPRTPPLLLEAPSPPCAEREDCALPGGVGVEVGCRRALGSGVPREGSATPGGGLEEGLGGVETSRGKVRSRVRGLPESAYEAVRQRVCAGGGVARGGAPRGVGAAAPPPGSGGGGGGPAGAAGDAAPLANAVAAPPTPEPAPHPDEPQKAERCPACPLPRREATKGHGVPEPAVLPVGGGGGGGGGGCVPEGVTLEGLEAVLLDMVRRSDALEAGLEAELLFRRGV